MVLVPSQDKGVGGNRGPLRGNLGSSGVFVYRSRSHFQFDVDGIVSTVGRIQKKCKLQLVTESSVWRTLCRHWARAALKEVRRAAQGRSLVVQLTECQGFIQRSQHRQMEEKRGTEGIGWSSRAFVQVVRRDGEKSRSSTQCGEPRGDTARTDPCRSSLCRGPPVESEVGRGGVRPFFVGAFSDVLQANQSVSVLGNYQILDSQSAMMQTIDRSLSHLSGP